MNKLIISTISLFTSTVLILSTFINVVAINLPIEINNSQNEQVMQVDYSEIKKDGVTSAKTKTKEISDKLTGVNSDILSEPFDDCDGTATTPCGTLELQSSKIKPLFGDQFNDKTADRINVVFVYSDQYPNTPANNILQLQNLLQHDSVDDLSNTPRTDFGRGFGFFSIEPMKSNKNKFNFWYYEDKLSETSPDIIGDDFRFFEEELGLSYVSPVLLTPNEVENSSFTSVLSIDYSSRNRVVNYSPGYGRMIKFPQIGSPITDFNAFVREASKFLFGLQDEMPADRPGVNKNPTYGLPNCARYDGKSRLLWSDFMNQVDPFYNEMAGILTAKGYPSSFIPSEVNIRVGKFNSGCLSNNIEEQFVPTKNSIMNNNISMPVYGSYNKSIVQSILNLFSGSSSVIPKPSRGLPVVENDNPQVSILAYRNPSCYRVLSDSRIYLNCSYEMLDAFKGKLIYKNENNALSLSYMSNAGEYLTADMPCEISYQHINCERIDITDVNQSGYLRYSNNNWFFKQVSGGFDNLNNFSLLNFDRPDSNVQPSLSSYNTIKENGLIYRSQDFNKDGMDDIFWYNQSSDEFHIWIMNNGVKSNTTYILPTLKQSDGYRMSAVGDFDGDGDGDVLWRKNDGSMFVWLLEKGIVASIKNLDNISFNSSWYISAIGNFGSSQANGVNDSTDDILWRNAITGEVHTWLLRNGEKSATGITDNVRIDTGWDIKAVCNFADSKTDQIVWLNRSTREFHAWIMDDGKHTNTVVNENLGAGWDIESCVDLNGDKFDDVIFQNTADGRLHVWKYELFTKTLGYNLEQVRPSSGWYIEQTGNYTGGNGGILWRNSISGETHVWKFGVNGLKISTGVNDRISNSSGWKAETITPIMNR